MRRRKLALEADPVAPATVIDVAIAKLPPVAVFAHAPPPKLP